MVQKELKKLESFAVHTKMSSEKKQFLMTLSTDFKNVNELQDILQRPTIFGYSLPRFLVFWHIGSGRFVGIYSWNPWDIKFRIPTRCGQSLSDI